MAVGVAPATDRDQAPPSSRVAWCFTPRALCLFASRPRWSMRSARILPAADRNRGRWKCDHPGRGV